MKTIVLALALTAALAVPSAAQEAAAPSPPPAAPASVEALTGEAWIGTVEPESWTAAVPGNPIPEGLALKTGPGASLTVRFAEGDLRGSVGENTVISLADLLLKARLEKLRGGIAPPAAGAEPTKMQVTPLTGVRGTEESEGKAEELKRDHYWQDDAEGGK